MSTQVAPGIIDIGPDEMPPDPFFEQDLADILDESLEAGIADDLDPESEEFYNALCERVVLFSQHFCDIQFFPYQTELAFRVVQAVLLGETRPITALQARQSGKSAVLGTVITALMVLMPQFAIAWPSLFGKYRKGFWVGVFAPTEEQANTVWSRVHDNLTSRRAKEMLCDPEIDDRAVKNGGKTKTVTLLNSGSFCRMQTANKKANIESKTYHFVLVDEAQDCDSEIVRRSVRPMLASTGGASVYTGTPRFHKNFFYDAIQRNKATRRRHQNHFEYTYKTVVKYNKDYRKFIAGEREELGENSNEFQMSYNCKWLLEEGMFISDEIMEMGGDKRLELIRQWPHSGVVVGIDPARSGDSTVVTVMWVDWNNPDPFGIVQHRIINWLEITNKPWEEQYAMIYNFLRPYNIVRIGVDGNGMGGPVAERLQLLFPGVDVQSFDSDAKNQADRWKYFKKVLERMQFAFPAGPKTRRLRCYKNFVEQMKGLETVYSGKYMLAAAPSGRNNHDDFADSACLAVWCTSIDADEEVESFQSPFAQRV